MSSRANEGWQRFLILAPAFVIGAGLIAAVLVLLVRAFMDSFEDLKNKRLPVGRGGRPSSASSCC